MIKQNLVVGISLATVMLSSCGGGDASSSAPPPVAAAPAPAPAPVPNPNATPAPIALAYTQSLLPSALNATVGLHQASSFTTLSWSYPETSASADANGTDIVRFGYDSSTTSSTVTLPGFTPGYLDALSSQSGTDFTGSLMLPAGGIAFTLLRPGNQNRFFPLDSTSVGFWQSSNLLRLQPNPTIGVLAYGVPTPSSELPSTGSFRFTLFGHAVYNGITEGILGERFGGELDVDFAAARVSGRFTLRGDPGYAAGNFATAQLVSTPILPDGSFSGTLQVPGSNEAMRFEGRFTGPQAREVMLRWNAPYPQNSFGFRPPTFGVLVGTRG